MLSSAVVKKLVFVDGYAEVKSLLKEVGKAEAEKQASYYAAQSRGWHGWTLDELGPSDNTRPLVASHGAKRQKCGGAPPLVARRHDLVKMCIDWFGQ